MSRLAIVRASSVVFAVSVLGLLGACGSSDSDGVAGDPSGVDSGGTGPSADSGNRDSATSPSSDASKPDGDSGNPDSNPDPSKDGPYTPAESDVSVSAATGDTLTMHVVLPTAGPTAGPFPIVFIGAGYLIPIDQYYGYAKRLATHGIVGVTVKFPQDATDQLKDAKDLQAALDWANAPGATLAAAIDPTRAGVMGHSRGGKAAVLAAARDARFMGVLGLDPVDSTASSSCDPVTQCPDASTAIASLKVPSGLLGEVLDETGFLPGVMSCAPADDNYTTFYASAPSPTFEVTIAGAGHMSFIGSSTLLALACKTPTTAQSVVLDLAYSYTAAFFLRNLAGKTAYDAYLVGPMATARYVTPGIATIDSK